MLDYYIDRGDCMGRTDIYVMSAMFNKTEIDEMEDILSRFLKHYNIELIPPVDIFDVLYKIGFDVRGAKFDEALDGLILVNEEISIIKGFDSNKVIAYNCNKNIMEKKFIVAHELAHYIEEKVKNIDTRIVVAARDHEGNYSSDKNEQRKDYIAAAILIPKDDLKKRFSKSHSEANVAEKIAGFYNVELTLAKRRIAEVWG